MIRFLQRRQVGVSDLSSSRLYDHTTFYSAFMKDMSVARNQIVIESPFITTRRMTYLLPALERLAKRGVQVIINTRDPKEHDDIYSLQAIDVVVKLQELGATVLYTAGHHRKLAIVDGRILWEGSLNILSHNDSCEVMRRTTSEQLARQMIAFVGLEKFLR